MHYYRVQVRKRTVVKLSLETLYLVLMSRLVLKMEYYSLSLAEHIPAK